MRTYESTNHITLARQLMASEDLASLRYAALEIRLAIELLFYQLLPSYKEELPDSIFKNWQPKRIIDALIDCDPHIEQDYTITMARELPSGGHGRPMHIGSYKAVNRKLLQQYYHKIGSYLHASMAQECRDLKKMKSFLNAAATRVEEYCRGTSTISNFGKFYYVNCICGRKIKRNAKAIQKKPYACCPSEKCGAVDFLKEEGNEALWKLRETEFICPQCETSNFFATHIIESSAIITCVECNQRYEIGTSLFARPLQESDKIDEVS